MPRIRDSSGSYNYVCDLCGSRYNSIRLSLQDYERAKTGHVCEQCWWTSCSDHRNFSTNSNCPNCGEDNRLKAIELVPADVPPKEPSEFLSTEVRIELRVKKTQTIEASGETLQEARAQLRKLIPQGQSVLSEIVVCDAKKDHLEGFAETTEAAIRKVNGQVPKDAEVTQSREIRGPQQRVIIVAAHNDAEARTKLREQLSKTDVILGMTVRTPGRRGILGLGKKLADFQAEILSQAIVEVKFKLPAKIVAQIGYRNRGDLHDTMKKALSYWMGRNAAQKHDPFVMSVFQTEGASRQALLELPCIHEDENGKLICTEILVYGYYPRDDGAYEALISGNDLTIDLWSAAKASFEKHGGKLKNDLKPIRSARIRSSAKNSPQTVLFVREDRTDNSTATYRTYKAPDAVSAIEFLDSLEVSRLVAQPLYYIVVDTPEGTYGRDYMGYYKEPMIKTGRSGVRQSTPKPAAPSPNVYVEHGSAGTVVRIFEPIDAAHIFVEEGVNDQLVFEELNRLHPDYLAQQPLPRVLVHRLSEWPDSIQPFAAKYLRQMQNVNLATAKHRAQASEAHGKLFYFVYLIR